MINIKKIIITLSFFLLLGCGFEPIYSKKNSNVNYNFSIKKIEFSGTNKINKYLKNNFTYHLNNDFSEKVFNLKINSQIIKSTASKDKQGNTEVFNTQIIVTLKILENNTVKDELIFQENFEYNNQENKFDLNQYEKDIQKNLTSKISQDIILHLYSYNDL